MSYLKLCQNPLTPQDVLRAARRTMSRVDAGLLPLMCDHATLGQHVENTERDAQQVREQRYANYSPHIT